MAEYIEREKAYELARTSDYYSDFHKSIADLTSLKELLDDTPAADVVEVVRCCKCKYGNKHNDCNGNEYYGCDINIDIGEVREVEPNHYCSYGERRCEE